MKWTRSTLALVVLCAALVVGCGGSPGGAFAPGSAGKAYRPAPSGAPSALPSERRPLLPVPETAGAFDGPARAAVRSAHVAPVGFALHVSGDLVAFDPRTGSELSRYVFGRELEDVCWDARTGRVLIAEHDAYSDGSRVHALSWTAGGFVHESSSPVLPGHSRVWAARDRVYVVSEEQGVVWNVLDDDLSPVGQFQPLVRPASLAERGGPLGGLLALDVSSRLAGQPADRLLGVSHPGDGWEVTQQSYPAPGRPSARLSPGPGPGSAFVLHKSPGEGTVELAAVSTLAPDVPPAFRVVMTGAGRGELEGTAYDPAKRVVVVAIARVPLARLLLVPTGTGRASALVPLDAPIENAGWWPRDLVRDEKSGRVLVATDLGLSAFLPAGSAEAPGLARDAGFSAPDLRGPVALAQE